MTGQYAVHCIPVRPRTATQLIQQWHYFFQRRSNSAFENKRKPGEGYRYCGAVHDFHFQLFQTLTFSGGEPTITAPGSRSCWRTQTRRVSGVQPIFEQWNKLPPIVSHIRPDFPEPTNCPLTDFGGKTSIFSHPVYSFSGSLVSRISGAVHSVFPSCLISLTLATSTGTDQKISFCCPHPQRNEYSVLRSTSFPHKAQNVCFFFIRKIIL